MKISKILIALFLMVSTVVLGQSEVEPNSTLPKASTITLVNNIASITGTINPARDTDCYKFIVARSGVVTYRLTNVPSTCAMQMKLYNTNQVEIQSKGGSDGQNFSSEFKLCQAGDYYIKLEDYWGRAYTQAYTLTVEFDVADVYECNDNIQAAIPITLSTPVSAAISSNGDIDWYKFTIPRSGMITYKVANLPPNIAMVTELYDADGVLVPNSRAGQGQGVNFSSEVKVCQSGNYYIKLYDYYGYANAQLYTLTVGFDATDVYECNDEKPAASPIALNTPISAAIRTDGDIDWYKFTVPRSGIITYKIANLPTNIAMVMEIYDVDGVFVPNSRGGQGQGVNFISEVKVCQGGDYYIKLYNYYGYANAQLYTLTVGFDATDVNECNDDFASATPIIKNLCATIRSANDIDIYSVQISRTGTYDFSIKPPSCLAMYARLYNANQVNVKEVANSNRGGLVTLSYPVTTTGLYYLQLFSYYSGEACAQTYCLTLPGAITSVTEDTNVAFNVSPNPVTDRLTLNYTEGSLKTATITDIAGRTLIQQTIQAPQAEMNVNSLAKGLYLLTVETTDGRRGLQKFVKN